MRKTAALFIILTIAGFLSGCGTARWVRTPILEGSRTTVNLEHRVEKDHIVPQQYDHPFHMPTDDVTKLLGDLMYTEKAVLIGEKDTPVFQDIEIAALAPALTDALTKATTDQRVQFISFNKGGGLLFKNTRKTEGVLFVEPKGRVNLAFNLINADAVAIEKHESPEMYTNSDPLKIKYADTALVSVSPYAVLRQLENGQPAPMWVVADAVKLREATASASKPAPVAAPAPATTAPAPAVTPAPAVAAPKPAVAQQPVSNITPAPAGTPSPDATQQDIKNKLKYLKELYEGGLITEAEYVAKKKKLLDKIE